MSRATARTEPRPTSRLVLPPPGPAAAWPCRRLVLPPCALAGPLRNFEKRLIVGA